MQKRPLFVPAAAMLWGLCVFAPVGLNYLSLFLLTATMIASGGQRERVTRMRANPLWWPIVAYVSWTLIVLAAAPHYPETPSNLWHGLRIAWTMLATLALSRREAIWALRGFLVMAMASIVLILLHRTFGLPMWSFWHATLEVLGNKSINNALLLTVLGASAVVFGLAESLVHRPGRAFLAFALTALVAIIITLWLVSRTSLLGLLLATVAACAHQWRRQFKPLAAALVLGISVAGVALWQSPGMGEKLRLGVHEIEAAQGGAVSEGSWAVRYYMYRDTARMVEDRPFMGWGIGGWTAQWHARGPALLANYNMPHNDFLWMGAQAGIPGILTLLGILLTGLWQTWRRHDITGRYGFVAVLIMLTAASFNSALRDAQIGLSLLWVTFIYLRLAQEPGMPWRELLPRRYAAIVNGKNSQPAPP